MNRATRLHNDRLDRDAGTVKPGAAAKPPRQGEPKIELTPLEEIEQRVAAVIEREADPSNINCLTRHAAAAVPLCRDGGPHRRRLRLWCRPRITPEGFPA
jgi:hypothetical protein